MPAQVAVRAHGTRERADPPLYLYRICASRRILYAAKMAPPDAPPVPEPAAHTLDEILRGDLLRSVFQPIFDLETGALFGFEALTRGPEQSALERPDQLFHAARTESRLADLDEACQRAAVAGARTNGIEAPLTLFVNAEPDAVGFGPLPMARRNVRGVVELTERTLTNRLAELLPAVQRARADGWGIALDDVGADTRSLALMPVLRPDVIKLDLRLVQEQPTPEIAAIAGAVGAQAERTGSTVLAEGIETLEQAQYARALGATLGQGFLFGRPSAQPDCTNPTSIPLPILPAAMPHARHTPFDLASTRRPVRHGRMPLLASISRELERQAARLRPTSLLISSFPDDHDSMAHIDTIYEELAGDLAFVAAMAVGMPPKRGPGLRGVSIREDDPLRGTWNVVVIGPHFASMLAAREHGYSAYPDDQEFDFVFTFDRALIVECAQALMLRIGLSDSPDQEHTPAKTSRFRRLGGEPRAGN
jgi:EAL domain-containing protein (putative c-di-GMP-specific phosphodiesterase class I)